MKTVECSKNFFLPQFFSFVLGSSIHFIFTFLFATFSPPLLMQTRFSLHRNVDSRRKRFFALRISRRFWNKKSFRMKKKKQHHRINRQSENNLKTRLNELGKKLIFRKTVAECNETPFSRVFFSLESLWENVRVATWKTGCWNSWESELLSHHLI